MYSKIKFWIYYWKNMELEEQGWKHIDGKFKVTDLGMKINKILMIRLFQ